MTTILIERKCHKRKCRYQTIRWYLVNVKLAIGLQYSRAFQGNLTKHHSQSSCIFSGFRNEFHLDHRTCHQMNLVVQKLRCHNLKFLRYLQRPKILPESCSFIKDHLIQKYWNFCCIFILCFIFSFPLNSFLIASFYLISFELLLV